MSPKTPLRAAALAALVALPLTFAAPRAASAADPAKDLKTVARETLAASRDAVVHVKAALKMTISMGGNEMPSDDQQVEVLGTVVHPSGLTVLSEASLNPGGMFEGLGGMLGGGDGEDGGFQMKSDVGDVKIVLADGKEVPARLVLRDKDLDLAFVVPTEAGGTYASVPLEGARTPEVLDDVIVVGRLGRGMDRTPTVRLGVVTALVKKPRPFYVVDAGGGVETGTPVFDAAGKTLGMLLQRRGASHGQGFAALLGQLMPVVLPASDVHEAAQQALAEAARPPKSDAAPAEPAKEPEAPAGDTPK